MTADAFGDPEMHDTDCPLVEGDYEAQSAAETAKLLVERGSIVPPFSGRPGGLFERIMNEVGNPASAPPDTVRVVSQRARLNAAAKVERDRAIVIDRNRGLSWSMIANRYRLSERQCRTIYSRVAHRGDGGAVRPRRRRVARGDARPARFDYRHPRGDRGGGGERRGARRCAPKPDGCHASAGGADDGQRSASDEPPHGPRLRQARRSDRRGGRSDRTSSPRHAGVRRISSASSSRARPSRRCR